MLVYAFIVAASHLSDAQELTAQLEQSSKQLPINRAFLQEGIRQRINFAKHIIVTCRDNMEKAIEPDEMYKEYIAGNPQFAFPNFENFRNAYIKKYGSESAERNAEEFYNGVSFL